MTFRTWHQRRRSSTAQAKIVWVSFRMRKRSKYFSDVDAGLAQLSNRSYELAVAVHDDHCSLNDRVRSNCRLALAAAKSGWYSKAMKMLDDLSPIVKGVLKLEQRIQAFAALVQLRRQLHR